LLFLDEGKKDAERISGQVLFFQNFTAAADSASSFYDTKTNKKFFQNKS
jgi:hypothetical protein